MSKRTKTQLPSPFKVSDDPVPELKFEKGDVRPFLITTPPPQLLKLRSLNKKDRIYLIVLILVSTSIRFQKLTNPNSVVFDEVHFGGFVSKYIKGTFFMDVHPPLAKMLFTGIASLAGFKGDFDFKKIGLEYPETTPYVIMRFMSACFGLGTILLLFLTLKASGVRSIVAFLASLLFSFENSFITISRYILLDAPLIFFIASTVYSFKRFQNEVPFTFQWYRSLISTGIALGFTISSKWVGLFTVAWIGILNVYDFWFLIGDLTVTPAKIFRQAVSRGTLLLGIPLTLYLFFFSIHFNMLSKEGDGGPLMSSAFRSTLEGNMIPTNILADVGVGSKVSLRHVITQGGYLHSHNYMYESGSKQQQVTLYPHLDDNNLWRIELYNVSTPPTSFEPITDGTKIRLYHTLTHRRLHSHDHKCPVSENDWQKEVSCYGFEGFEGDVNDDFVVEIQKDYSKSGVASERVKSIDTVFRLRHAMTGCYLFSHEVKLPKWGFEQQEVTCTAQGVLDKSLWYIEHNENEFLPEDSERTSYKPPSLLKKMIESHKKMWQINKGLNSPHSYESFPRSWPFLLKGINYWGENNRQIYLLGNAPTWWATSAIIFALVVYFGVQVLKWHLGARIATDPHIYNFNVQVLHYILGYLLHYLPSFLMSRQMFLHHYLPAYYFGILVLAHFFDILVSYVFSRKRTIGYVFIGAFVAVAFLFYVNYSPIIYGTPWTKAQCQASKLLNGWNYDCAKFHDKISDYSNTSAAPSKLFDTAKTFNLN